jgi:regulation of enolase protein 1 (concanavalin A-like superfamily)
VTQNGYSDWAAQDIPQETKEIWFKIKRKQDDYQIYSSLDGENYKQIRLVHMQKEIPEVKIGAYLCTPSNKEFSATLSQISIKK